MLISEQYGWRMEYYVGNEDSDKGGINVALKFGEKVGEEVKDTVRVIWEEDPSVVSTSRYVLRSDSGLSTPSIPSCTSTEPPVPPITRDRVETTSSSLPVTTSRPRASR